MPAKKSYSQAYVDSVRARVEAQVERYRRAADGARQPGEPKPPAGSAFALLEPVFFNNLLLALDSCFAHRARTVEGRDGNPLNEVRLLCRSLQDDERLRTYPWLRVHPEQSVLGHRPGDPIALSEAQFLALAGAYFDELEKRFVNR